MKKVQTKPRIEEIYFNIIKAIQTKLVPNTILKGEKFKVFPVKSENKSVYLLPSF